MVKLLLERDDVVLDQKDDSGNTPLDLARIRGHEEIVNLLTNHHSSIATPALNQLPGHLLEPPTLNSSKGGAGVLSG